MRTLGVLVGVGVLLLARPQSRYLVTMEQLKDNLYLLEASGMAVAALLTDDGVVLVDTMPRGWWGQAVLNKIRSVTDKPIVTVINTHAHGDHIGNAAIFSTTMVDVVMQEGAKFHIVQSDVAGVDKAKFHLSSTFADKMSLKRGDDRIDLYHFGPGHTNGDSWVVFPSLRIMHIGDLAYKDDAPSFDRAAGGSGVAYPDTLARGLAALKDVDTIIVGHSGTSGHVISRRDLEEHQRLGARLLSTSREAIRAGKSASETAEYLGRTEDFKRFRRDRVMRAVEVIYEELQEAGAGEEAAAGLVSAVGLTATSDCPGPAEQLMAAERPAPCEIVANRARLTGSTGTEAGPD